MATYAGRRLHEMTDNAAHIIAIELLAAAQGIELRRPLESSPPLEAILSQIRARSAFMAEDRPLAGDIGRVAAWLLGGGLGVAESTELPKS